MVLMNNKAYILEGIWKAYRSGDSVLYALKNVNLVVYRGEFVSIMGPSGSGKSTLLSIMGLLTKPTRGRMKLFSYDASDLSDRKATELRRKTIGFIFQTFNLIPWLTALENVEIAMAIGGCDLTKRRERARELLVTLGLGERLDHRPTQLSGGEQQRVAIARALANDPEIILADEPTGNLSTTQGEMIVDILRSLTNQNRTVVMATHDPRMAEKSDRIVRLRDGAVASS